VKTKYSSIYEQGDKSCLT